jgi:hypothetical protein
MRLRTFCASALLVVACSKGGTPPAAPALLYADFDVDFGDVALDGQRVVELPVRSLTGETAYLKSTLSGPFTIENPGRTMVPADADVLVRIAFRPTVEGEVVGQLQLALEGLDNPPIAVRLHARGVTPTIAVEVPGWNGQNKRSIEFGAVPLGAHTTEVSVAITNMGAVTATVRAPPFEDDQPFWFLRSVRVNGVEKNELVKGVDLPPLAPATTARLRVVYKPTAPEPQSALLELAPCSSCLPAVITLSGTGVYPEVTAEPPQLGIGEVLVGESQAQSIELVGFAGLDLPFDLHTLSITGPAASAFSIPAAIAPRQVATGRLTVPVVFAPTFVGPAQAVLLADVDGGTVTVPLTGLGTSETIRFDPGAIDFGYWPAGVGTSALVKVTAPDTGSAVFAGAHLEGDAAFHADLPAGPFSITGSSLQFSIDLLAPQAGHASGSLVLDPGQPGQVEVRLPLSAEVVPSNFCNLWVSPGALRFGLRPLGSTSRRSIRLFNAGSTPCSFGGLEVTGAGAFSLDQRWPDVQTLASGQAVEVELAYRPTFTGDDIDRAVLHIHQPSKAVPELEIPVTGEGAGRVAAFDPQFAQVALGEAGLATATLRNDGRSGVHVLSLHLDDAASATFGVAGSIPEEIGPQSSVSIPISFRPRYVGERSGALEIYTDIGREPVIAQLSALGIAGCIDNCGSLEVTCRSFTAPAFDWVQLGTAALDPTGKPVACSFAVHSGKTPELIEERGCDADVVLGGAGKYQIELIARSESGDERRCTTTVEALGTDALVVRSWPEATTGEIDLRLFHPDAGDPGTAAAWGASAEVCWSGNPNPSWDSANSYDDPVFHNGRNGMPDVIRIPSPVQQKLGIGVRWASGTSREFNARTEVICASSVSTLSTDFSRLYTASHQGDVTVSKDGSCTVTPVGHDLYLP